MRVVELFCGAGGMSLGLTQAGFEVVGAFDNMPDAIATYRANLGDHVHRADLYDVLTIVPRIRALAPNMIAGGPPCQDYSPAGGRVEGPNARLTLAFAMAIVGVRPEWFLMENVVQAATSRTWAQAKAVLRDAGYGISESKIAFDRYGVPQARRRLIVVGRLGERDNFLNSAIVAKASPESMTLREALASKYGGTIPGTNRWSPDVAKLLAKKHIYTRTQQGGRAVRTVDEPYSTIVSTSGERATENFRASYVPHHRDSALLEKTNALDREYLCLVQGFPLSWEWVTRNQRRRMVMIANAVPPPAAKRIGEVILARAKGKTSPEIEGNFRQWLLKDGRRSRATASNIASNLKRARKLLGGRTFVDTALELANLEAVPTVAGMKSGPRSDLRQALTHYAEYLEHLHKRQRHQSGPIAVERVVIAQPPKLDLAAMMARLGNDQPHQEMAVLPDDG
ncbi:DNA (cytosine-5)-methyltransferase 1 [Rhizobium sp. PP-F2F-G36]|nr:DNA (cytosine-5)-methyltransferase 1 [Rhizobium sp. PP-F2F-G36]